MLPAVAIEKYDLPLDDFLLFELQLDQNVLEDGVSVYRDGELLFLPLGSLSKILSIAVEPSPLGAAGFIIREEQTFVLNLQKNQVKINGETQNYEPHLVRQKDGEIFVESSLYSKWFPVDFNINIPNLGLTALPRETLPVQARLKREAQLKTTTLSEPGRIDFENYDSPYSLLDKPFIDQTFEGALSGTKASKPVLYGSYTTLMTADFLNLETHLFVNGSDKKNIENFRLTMGRDDPDSRLLGFMQARSFALGHVNTPQIEYVAQVKSTGVGFRTSNRLLTRPALYDKQNFTGTLLPGWDVELFHNGTLLGYQTSKEKSQYEFNDVPLLFGDNDFRLVFYGPAGQIREEKTQFKLEDSMVLPGETYYSLTAVQLKDGSTRSMLMLDRSLSARISASTGVTVNDVPLRLTNFVVNPNFRSRTHYNLGLRSYFKSIFLSTDGVTTSNGGTLGAVSMKSGVNNSTLSVSHAVLKNYVSDEFVLSEDPITSSSKFSLDNAVPYFSKFPISLTGTYQQTASQQNISTIAAKLSTTVGQVAVTNRVAYMYNRGTKVTNGELQLSGRIADYNLRGSLNYDIEPAFKPISVNINGNINFSQNYNFTQSLSSQFQSNETRLDLSLNKSIGKYGFGLSAAGSNLGDYSIGLRLNIAIGFEPSTAAVFTSGQAMASTGAVRVQAYADNNSNGTKDAGDTPLAGVGFKVNGGLSTVRTDENGHAIITHLPTQQRVNLGVDRSTIEDPQQTPSVRGVRLLPRPGKIAEINFPFVSTTEIDGTIYLEDESPSQVLSRGPASAKKPASDLNLELVDYDDRNRVISRTTTAFDGYYILGEVPAGRYILQVERSHAQSRKIQNPHLKIFKILPNSDFISGVDFTVKSRAPQERQIANQEQDQYRIVFAGQSSPQNIDQIISTLERLKIPYNRSKIKKPTQLFQVQLNFARAEASQEAKGLLNKYNYRTTLLNSEMNSPNIVGSFSDERDALKEKSVVMAAFPAADVKVKSTMKLDITEITVEGFTCLIEVESLAETLRQDDFLKFEILVVKSRAKSLLKKISAVPAF